MIALDWLYTNDEVVAGNSERKTEQAKPRKILFAHKREETTDPMVFMKIDTTRPYSVTIQYPQFFLHSGHTNTSGE